MLELELNKTKSNEKNITDKSKSKTEKINPPPSGPNHPKEKKEMPVAPIQIIPTVHEKQMISHNPFLHDLVCVGVSMLHTRETRAMASSSYLRVTVPGTISLAGPSNPQGTHLEHAICRERGLQHGS